MDNQAHSDRSAEEYLSRIAESGLKKPIPPELSGLSKTGCFNVSGIVHCLQTDLQTDVKKGLPVLFEHISSTAGNAVLHSDGTVILPAGNACLALLWFCACVSPLLGTTASLELRINGAAVSGGSASAQSAYQVGAEMSLTALTVVSLQKDTKQTLALVNSSTTADIAHASLVMILFDPAACS